MALCIGTSFHQAILSFQLDTLFPMAPVGVDAPTSHSRDKQPAQSPPDATSTPLQPEVSSSSGAALQGSMTDQCLTSLENSLSQLLSLIQQAQELQQSWPPEQPPISQQPPPLSQLLLPVCLPNKFLACCPPFLLKGSLLCLPHL